MSLSRRKPRNPTANCGRCRKRRPSATTGRWPRRLSYRTRHWNRCGMGALMLRHPVGALAAAAGATGIMTIAPVAAVLNVVEPGRVAGRRRQAISAAATTSTAGNDNGLGNVAVGAGIVPGAGHQLMIALRAADACGDGVGRAPGINIVAVKINVPTHDRMTVAGGIRCQSKRRADLLIIARCGDGNVYRGCCHRQPQTSGRQQEQMLHQ